MPIKVCDITASNRVYVYLAVTNDKFQSCDNYNFIFKFKIEICKRRLSNSKVKLMCYCSRKR